MIPSFYEREHIVKDEILRQLKRTLRVVSGFPSVQIFINEVGDLFDFFQAYRLNQYRDISLATLFSIVFALFYLISPIDLFPDFIPIIGWLDDIAVVRFVIEMIRSDLSKFRFWKNWMDESGSTK